MEPLSCRICFPEKPEWRSARVRLCEVIVCKQGQAFAAAFILLWLAGRLCLWKNPSCGTAHLSQVQWWTHTDIWCYARSIIFSMSVFCKPCAVLCRSWRHSMVLFTYTRSVKIMRNMLCRTDLRMSFKGITSSIYIRAWAVQQSHVSLPALIQQIDKSQNYNAVKLTSLRFVLY